MQNFVPALLRLTSRPTYWRIAVILPGRILWRTYSRVEYPTPDDAVRRCLAGLLFPDVSMAALKPGVHTPPSSDEEKSGDDKHHDANKTQGAITHEHPRSDFKKLIHKLLLPPEAACSFDDAAAESQSKFSRSEGQVHDSALHYDPSNRYHRSHCGYPDNDSFHDLLLSGGIQPQADQRAKESHHGHAEPQRWLPAVEGDEATQHGLPHALSAKQAKNPRDEQDQRDTQPFLAGHAQPRRQFLGGPQNKISEDSQSEGGNVEDVNAIHPRPLPPVRVRAAWWGWL